MKLTRMTDRQATYIGLPLERRSRRRHGRGLRDDDDMFAFAIWDQQKRRLFLARDRVGKKPLYYANNDTCFAFASELQGLLQCPGSETRIGFGCD